MTLLAAEYTDQAMVTNWPARLFWVGVLLACIAVTLWLIRRGWVRRARRFSHLPALDRQIVDGSTLASGRYLGSTVAGEWLDRITAAGLGSPNSCELVLGEAGLSFRRSGPDDFTVSRAQLVSVRTDRGLLGGVYGPEGIVVVTWQWGDVLVDSGFRADPVTDHAWVLEGLAPYRVPNSHTTQGGEA